MWCTIPTITITNLCTEIQEAVIEDISEEVEKCIDSYFSKAAGAVQPSQPPAAVALAGAIREARLQGDGTGRSAQLRLLTSDTVQPEYRQVDLKRRVKLIVLIPLFVDA